LGTIKLLFNSGAFLPSSPSVAGPLFFANRNQFNLQIPWEVSVTDPSTLAPQIDGITHRAVSVSLAVFAPGIFTMDSSGKGQGAIVSVNSGQIAAPPGAISNLLTSPA